MRTTLSLEPDVLAAARRLAKARSESLGKIVSDLMRRGLETPALIASKSGFPVFEVSRFARPLLLADIKCDEDHA